MLDTLQKMSGTTHKSFADSKTVTQNNERLVFQKEGNVSITLSTREVPVISYNDMAFISERNSIVFRAGDSPVWNRNQTILPMSWRLFKNTIEHAGHEYTLQTIPTLSSALDFDIRKNQPDFMKMLNKRMQQAYIAEQAKQKYQEAYGYSDYEIEQLDPDNYADEIMSVINNFLRQKNSRDEEEEDMDAFEAVEMAEFLAAAEANNEQLKANAEAAAKMQASEKKIYAGGLLSKEDLVSATGGVQHTFDRDILAVYTDIKGDMWNDRSCFTVKNGNLCGLDGTPYIVRINSSEDLAKLSDASKDAATRVFAEDEIRNVKQEDIAALGSYDVTDAFYHFLISMNKWSFANGRFEAGMTRRMNM